jgi:hypothetical protein
MESYGLVAIALIGAAFYGLRRVPTFVVCGAAIVAVFAIITYPSLAPDRAAEWYVMTTGLLASLAGFLVIRLMLIRSVSLQLLARIDDVAHGAFQYEISERLNDMRVLHLVHSINGRNTLTLAGRLAAAAVAAIYRVFGISA